MREAISAADQETGPAYFTLRPQPRFHVPRIGADGEISEERLQRLARWNALLQTLSIVVVDFDIRSFRGK